MLHSFLEWKRTEIIARAKAKVLARAAPRATEVELNQGIPLFFGQLIDTLEGLPARQQRNGARKSMVTRWYRAMLRSGFSVGDLVHDYGDLCQAVTEPAFELGAQITVDEFHTLSRYRDDAVAESVTEYGRVASSRWPTKDPSGPAFSCTSCATISAGRCSHSVFSKAEP